MVGGFSESPYLKASVKGKFEKDGLTILVPKRPQVSVIRGACMFGLNPRSITSRIYSQLFDNASFKSSSSHELLLVLSP